MTEYITAFLAGLFGGIHCVGMCGGIVSILGFGVSPDKKQSPSALIPILLGYNIGRIFSYTLAGALIGGLSATFISLANLHESQLILQTIAALFMITLGLYIANIWNGLIKIELLGKKLWQNIEPFSRRFIPVTGFTKAVPLGFFWGWLPCGLVYSVLIMTLSAGSATKGALLMLAFGLGTLPNLLAMGFVATKLTEFTRKPAIKLLAGLVIIAMGAFMLLRNFAL